MRTRDLRKRLRELGCLQVGTVGSHEKWSAPGGHGTVVKAGEKEQAPGTLREIQRHLAPEFGDKWLEEGQ
jgi:predicted RNA binding protein YcfA (HicA-like mRNA interferase family)